MNASLAMMGEASMQQPETIEILYAVGGHPGRAVRVHVLPIRHPRPVTGKIKLTGSARWEGAAILHGGRLLEPRSRRL